jgi:hypothetical protein
MNLNYYWAICGPTTSNGKLPAFDWRDWKSFSHEGMPDIFNFQWQKIRLDVEQNRYLTT